jgi:asparagine synthase (glutamine-hydrolysing)
MDRDRFGLRRLYYRPGGRAAASLRSLVSSGDALDPEGVRFALGAIPWTARTWIAGVLRAPPGHRLIGDPLRPEPIARAAVADPRPLGDRLLAALERIVTGGKRAALSLSGGLDSALLLALLAGSFRARMPAVYVFAPRLPGGESYDESEAAVALARSLDLQPIVVHATDRDFAGALPACVAAAETPLYNLHPVAKHLLFTRMAADGVEIAITGDGADQAFSGAPSETYLPIAGAIADAAGVALACPFLDDAVVALAGPADPHKRALRNLARTLLPDAIALAPKAPRLAPPIDLGRHADPAREARLAEVVRLDPGIDGDRRRTGLVTLRLACDALGVREV